MPARTISRRSVEAPGFVRFSSGRSSAVFTRSRSESNSVRRYVLSRSQRAMWLVKPTMHSLPCGRAPQRSRRFTTPSTGGASRARPRARGRRSSWRARAPRAGSARASLARSRPWATCASAPSTAARSCPLGPAMSSASRSTPSASVNWPPLASASPSLRLKMSTARIGSSSSPRNSSRRASSRPAAAP